MSDLHQLHLGQALPGSGTTSLTGLTLSVDSTRCVSSRSARRVVATPIATEWEWRDSNPLTTRELIYSQPRLTICAALPVPSSAPTRGRHRRRSCLPNAPHPGQVRRKGEVSDGSTWFGPGSQPLQSPTTWPLGLRGAFSSSISPRAYIPLWGTEVEWMNGARRTPYGI